MNLDSASGCSRRAVGTSLLGACLSLAVLQSACTATQSQAVSVSTETVVFWPLPPDEPRVQFVRDFQYSTDITGKQVSRFEEMIFGEADLDDLAIDKPYGIDMRDGRIYVCDMRYPALTVLDLVDNQMRRVGTTGINRMTHPVDVSVADDGMIYVADNQRNTVLVYDQDERYAGTIGGTGLKPVALAVHGDRLYVCDIEAQHIAYFDRLTGERLGEIGSVGDTDGQFRVPLSVDVGDDGRVYVTDLMRYRVQRFSPDGEFIDGVGQLGDTLGAFARPKQIAVDSEGIVYVVDAAFQNVQMFSDSLELLMHFGSIGEFPGSMNLPAGVCVSNERLDLMEEWVHEGFEPLQYVAVTNQFGPSKVSLYVMGQLRDGWSVEDLAPSVMDIPIETGNEASGLDLGATSPSLPVQGTDQDVPDQADPTEDQPPSGGLLE